MQCCGSEFKFGSGSTDFGPSGSGSTDFFDLLDPDPLVSGMDPNTSIIKQK